MSTKGESSKAPDIPSTISMTSIVTHPSVPSALFKPSPFLDRLTKWLSSVLGTDQLIMLIQYSLDIIIHHMNIQTRERLIALLLKHFASLGIAPTPNVLPTPSALATRLKLLSEKLADVRIFLRLHGIIPTYQWLLSTHASPPEDPTIALVTKLQTYANMLYFPLENAAYLSSHSIIPMNKSTELSLWIWSARFWAAHVLLDLIRLGRERQIMKKGKTKETVAQDEKKWWAQLFADLAYAPISIHYSLENGLGFKDVELGYLGVVAAVASIYSVWQQLD